MELNSSRTHVEAHQPGSVLKIEKREQTVLKRYILVSWERTVRAIKNDFPYLKPS